MDRDNDEIIFLDSEIVEDDDTAPMGTLLRKGDDVASQNTTAKEEPIIAEAVEREEEPIELVEVENEPSNGAVADEAPALEPDIIDDVPNAADKAESEEDSVFIDVADDVNYDDADTAEKPAEDKTVNGVTEMNGQQYVFVSVQGSKPESKSAAKKPAAKKSDAAKKTAAKKTAAAVAVAAETNTAEDKPASTAKPASKTYDPWAPAKINVSKKKSAKPAVEEAPAVEEKPVAKKTTAKKADAPAATTYDPWAPAKINVSKKKSAKNADDTIADSDAAADKPVAKPATTKKSVNKTATEDDMANNTETKKPAAVDKKAATAEKKPVAPAKKATAPATEKKAAPAPADKKAAAPAADKKAAPVEKKPAAADKKVTEEKVLVAGDSSAPHGKFVIKKTDKGNFVYKLFSSNRRVLATPGGAYKDLNSCKSGIQSVINNAATAPIEDKTLKNPVEQKCPKWEIYFDNSQEVRLRLIASNGNVVAITNDGYTSKDAAKKGIDAIARAAKGADIVRNDDLW